MTASLPNIVHAGTMVAAVSPVLEQGPAPLIARADYVRDLRRVLPARVFDRAGSRLAHGWRNQAVGANIRRLVGGEAALAFDGKGGLVLEERTNRPI